MAELMKKYKAAVQQSSVDTRTLMEQSKQIEELMHERQLLQEQVGCLTQFQRGEIPSSL